MKHKRRITGIGLATIMLVSLCAVYASASVSAEVTRNPNTQSGIVGAPVGFIGAPAVISQYEGSYDLFATGLDHAVWWRHDEEGTWSAWKSLGGYVTSPPAAAMTDVGICVAARSVTGTLIIKWGNGITWGSWYDHGGSFVGAPAVASWGPYHISAEFFVRGTDNALWRLRYDQIDNWWFEWTSLGKPATGGLTSSPAAASFSGIGIEVAVRGGNGDPWFMYTTDGGRTWGEWGTISGKQLLAGTSPALVDIGGGNIKTFITGTDHKVYLHAGGTSWTSLGTRTALVGGSTSSPAAASHTANAIDVFVRDRYRNLWSMWTEDGGANWSLWYEIVE
jgi:hypothetical protein